VTRPTFCVVSLNPAIDAEWRVDDVLWEEKNLVYAQRRWAGGKGINVARWLKALGATSELLIPFGGETGRELERQLSAEKIPAHIIPLQEESRVNVAVTTRAGRQMRFNQPGAAIDAGSWREIFSHVMSVLASGTHVVISGSLPPCAASHVYARMIGFARSGGARVFLDCDGEPFAEAVSRKPFLVKPNRHEIELWAGESIRSAKSLRSTALKLSRVTEGWVLVSLGPDGAMLVNATDQIALQAAAPKVTPKTTLGAGDAALAAAALASVRGLSPEEWLRDAVAAGTAATQCEAGRVASARELAAMRRRVGPVVAV
jgi:1-phosphofructokinase family hexose kinase